MIIDFLQASDWSHLISQGSALFQVILIDLVMAGDNAVAVGLAAAGLPAEQRKKAIMWGLVGAIVTRIIFVLLTVQLLQITGLLIAGGILLVWVAWKMWRELREQNQEHQAEESLEEATGVDIDQSGTVEKAKPSGVKPKSLRAAIIQILVADVSMSLDNVLAVAGAAHQHVEILVFGLILAIILMGAAAHVISNVLHKYRWIGYVGLAVIAFVAGRMIWEGHRDVVVDLNKVDAYNQFMPEFLDISKEEIKHFSVKTLS